MTIRPLKDKVAVKYYKKEEEKSKGGLVLPDTAREENHNRVKLWLLVMK